MNEWDIVKIGNKYKIVTVMEAFLHEMSHPVKPRSGWKFYGNIETVKILDEAIKQYVVLRKKGEDE